MSIDVLRRVLALTPDERDELLGQLCSEFPEVVQEALDLWAEPATASPKRQTEG